MDERDDDMPPVLMYSTWRPPEVTVRRQVKFAVAGTFIGGAATVVLLFCAAAATGGGHGSFLPAKVLFPFSMALTSVTEGVTQPLLIVAGAQYPLYGLIAGWLIARNRRRAGLMLLLGIHFCGLALAMAFAASTFSP